MFLTLFIKSTIRCLISVGESTDRLNLGDSNYWIPKVILCIQAAIQHAEHCPE